MSLSALNLRVHLPLFEGPLALLLYLIRKEEMDIMDIQIHDITKQYLDYIKMMREMDLEVAGEFVAMAATLIQIKSQMLLPHYNEQGEVVTTEDPRKELVQKLIEYQRYQEGAQLLAERPWLGRDVFTRGVKEKFEQEPQIDMEENALFGLIASFRGVMRSAEKRVHHVAKKLQSIAGRIKEISNHLTLNIKVPLRSLINQALDQRQSLLITFLSSLEMAKMGFVRLFQSDNFEEIYIEAIRNIDELALSRVEEYDTAGPAIDLIKNSQVALSETEPVAGEDAPLNILTGEESLLEDEGAMSFGGQLIESASDDDILDAELELGMV